MCLVLLSFLTYLLAEGCAVITEPDCRVMSAVGVCHIPCACCHLLRVLHMQDGNLRHTLQFGIGLHHAGLNENDRSIVEHLFVGGKIQV